MSHQNVKKSDFFSAFCKKTGYLTGYLNWLPTVLGHQRSPEKKKHAQEWEGTGVHFLKLSLVEFISNLMKTSTA